MGTVVASILSSSAPGVAAPGGGGQTGGSSLSYSPGTAAPPPTCPPGSAATRTGCRSASTTAPSSTSAPPPPPSTSTSTPPRSDGSPLPAIGAAVAIAGLFTFLATRHADGRRPQRGDQPADADDLLRDGPQLPDNFPAGTFAVRGFAKDGWPVVLDFSPQRGTQTRIDVIYGKDRTASILVDSNGWQGRHLQAVTLPATGWAKRATPATYVVRSRMTDHMGRPTATIAPVEVYGFGGGPRAVGSVAIEDLQFGPSALRLGSPARFGYRAKSPFDRTRAEVLRFQADGNTIRLARVMEARADDVTVGVHEGSWDGRQGEQPAAPGSYRFQVRGWFTSDDKSWVGAVAQNLVTVK